MSRNLSRSESFEIKFWVRSDISRLAWIWNLFWSGLSNYRSLVLQTERNSSRNGRFGCLSWRDSLSDCCQAAHTTRRVRPSSPRSPVMLIAYCFPRFPWAMRIMGFMMLATLGFSNIVLARRLPPKDMPGGIFNIGVFKSKIFSIYCSSVFVCFLGIYTGRRRSPPSRGRC
jgi:hypothetical protein